MGSMRGERLGGFTHLSQTRISSTGMMRVFAAATPKFKIVPRRNLLHFFENFVYIYFGCRQSKNDETAVIGIGTAIITLRKLYDIALSIVALFIRLETITKKPSQSSKAEEIR